MTTKADIRACPELSSEITSETGLALDVFLSRFDVDEDDSIDVFALLEEIEVCRQEGRDHTAKTLIASNGGDAYGLELAHLEYDGKLACIFSEPSWRGGIRLSLYDIHGPISHHIYTTPEEALDEALRYGYCKLATGQLDLMTDLPSWKCGLERVMSVAQWSSPFATDTTTS